jgi:hypothetical protein
MKVTTTKIDVIVKFLKGGQAEPISFRHNNHIYKIRSIETWRFDRRLPSQPHDRIYSVLTEDNCVANLRWETWVGNWLLEDLKKIN